MSERPDPSRGDHSWNDRSDDERRDITEYVFNAPPPKTEVASVSKSGNEGPGPKYGGAVAAGGAGVAAGTGPGKTAVNPGGGGSGPGSGGTGMLGQLVWVKANKTIGVEAHEVHMSDLPMLRAVLEPTNTSLMIGGKPFIPHPGTSNAQEIEDLMGDGDNPLELSWWMKQTANAAHIQHNLQLWANDPATQQWAKDFDEAITPW